VGKEKSRMMLNGCEVKLTKEGKLRFKVGKSEDPFYLLVRIVGIMADAGVQVNTHWLDRAKELRELALTMGTKHVLLIAQEKYVEFIW